MRPLLLTALILAVQARSARADDFPAPPPPADSTLVKWATVVDYFRKADDASDRVSVRELGKTTEGRPYLAAFVSSPETIRDLDRYRRLQRRIAQVEDADDPKLIPESKAVVLITCSIHSTETASTFMAMRLLHDLATKDDAATKEILDKTILILVPSANPDGVDIVADWYERTKGHPWEGDGLPRLYHKYAGHDTNRDWFMLNLKETQLLTRLLYEEWFPTLAYDVHQMGSRGARLFVPPFYDPINPNLDPRIHQSIATIGAHMASDLAAQGKRGVLTHAMYDNWWNGGNRTTPQRHNIVAVLTEAASVKMASPIFLDKEQLRAGSRGMADHRPAINFVDPWPGGWWRLADIEEYERICARSFLTLAARYKDRFQSDYLAMGLASIEKGKSEPPFGWVVPMDVENPGTAAKMVSILQRTGIRVHRAKEEFRDSGVRYPAGSYVMLAAQPYRAHLKDMMEKQEYPARFTANGEAEAPYDVAGWTLPLQMGVRAGVLSDGAPSGLEPVERIEAPKGGIVGDAAKAKTFRLANRSNDDFLVLNALLDAGIEVRRAAFGWQEKSKDMPPAGTLLIQADEKSRAALDKVLPGTSSRVVASPEAPPKVAKLEDGYPLSKEVDATDDAFPKIARRRIGLYQPWVPSMDEGWTRLVLEDFGFRYQTLHNADIRAGRLKERIDTLLIPSIEAKTLRDGYAPDETEPRYVGGLGREGTAAIRAFLADGGTLVCLEDACTYAIEELDLGITNVVKGAKTSEFYGPGSIVKVYVEPTAGGDPIPDGMPPIASAYFDRSMAFEVHEKWQASLPVKYAGPKTVLQSGWLLGGSKIAGKGAVADMSYDKGRIILFGFPPQHRGQTHGTFRLLFNALYR